MASTQRVLRGVKTALNANGRFKYKSPESEVDYLVIGGGVVGLGIAQRLSHQLPDKSVYLIERHPRAGEETSSRNSEVIHAGIYYPPDSLKTRLCLRGRQLMYERCKSHNIPHKKTGKLVVAHSDQLPYIRSLHEKAQKLSWPPHSHREGRTPVPTELLSGEQARELEPDLSKDIAGALWSPETGIVDSHTLMESLEKDISEAENAELVYSTRVVRIDKGKEEEGWVVQMVTGEDDVDTGDSLLAKTVINTCGLSSPLIRNAIHPREQWLPMYFARGSYASYKGPGVANVSRLLYPCPDNTGHDGHNFQSLGTHLTLDLDGKVRFGPDLEWIDPAEEEVDNPDFWMKHLVPDGSKMEEMHRAVTKYLPEVRLDGLAPDYAGFRPKLAGPGTVGGFNDFTFLTDYPSDTNVRACPMINLLAIESPGLTASLAIAEYVVDDKVVGEHTTEGK
ncbi:FAD dependent oxidoreductase [Punctularia strigosozonata HHB-11173 SS5]|uniref:FAD dependent oxidoreductase n=1 Tax=Punctularia strigosozonata (strain HHB-11173) TaxID=741275 RepID=UPI0004416776|nr:FAD dependent oxidoreductase [Punctularia strigosozonata HHB-11173 SS5]EIN10477.1 FAD dependent oxidoreductase [Punctularia strigosozonata HHB-11173 SS5]